ncbi:MAG: allophanate hydrolase, partial [Pelagibacteraceae bacterium]|nr:allophanate hydrolase [Pelagibacteraceae bacterium]
NSKKKIEFNFDENNSIRVMKGLQFSYFSKESQKNFFLKEYEITKLTDRMGMRLEGEKLQNVISSNIKSEGITKGSIQVPGDGQPIILLSDHPTIGGYPKIANVITADYDKLVQKAPGTKINFKLVDISIAESAFEEYLKRLNNNLNAIRL